MPCGGMQTERNETQDCWRAWCWRLVLVMLSGIIHLLYHREYAETDTPNDCFCGVGGDGGDGAAQNRLPDL